MTATTDVTGFVVAWTCPAAIPLPRLREGLTLAGRDPDLYAPDLRPMSRLARTATALAHDNTRNNNTRTLARPVATRARQLTRETDLGDRLGYDREATLTLTENGTVRADDPHWQQAADTASQHADTTRTANDVTRIVQRIVETAGSDLIPVRPQGGCYFVPQGRRDLIDSLTALLAHIGGQLTQFAVTVGHGTDDSVANTLADYLLRQIAELNGSIDALKVDGSPKVKARRVLEVAAMRKKLDNYSVLLGAMHSKVAHFLSATDARLSTPTTEAPANG